MPLDCAATQQEVLMAFGFADGAAIAALSDEFADCFNRGDLAALAAMYADDAVLLPPGPRTISGRRNIRSYWEQAERFQQLTCDTLNVKPLGDGAACEIGNLRITLNTQGPQTRDIAAKYVFVWRKSDGEWKIETSIWNSVGGNRPARRRGGRGAMGAARALARGRGEPPARGGRGGAGGRGGPAPFVPRVE
jgi:uncharacterized protein (TIGR02246 family)